MVRRLMEFLFNGCSDSPVKSLNGVRRYGRSQKTRGFMKAVPILILAIALSACSDLGEYKDVYVSVNPPTLTITNPISEPIYYFVVGQKESALIDWMPFCGEANRIPEGKTKKVDCMRQLVAGESTLLVYWWKGVRNEDGTLVPTEMTSIRVQIR
jgi:hypothetical protein